MDNTIYSKIQENSDILKASDCLDLIIQKDKRSNVVASAWSLSSPKPLAVSFPQHIRHATYDIELSENRETVGRAYAITLKASLWNRIAVVKAVIGDAFLEVFVTTSEERPVFHVFLNRKFTGVAKLVKKLHLSETYRLESSLGESTAIMDEGVVRVFDDQSSGEKYEFPVQLNLQRLPNLFQLFSSKPQANESIIFVPDFSYTDPYLVMGLVLAIRMTYVTHDFS